MKLFGVSLRQPNLHDMFLVGIVVLLLMAIAIPLAELMNSKPSVVLTWTFASGSGAILASLGINVTQGKKQIAIVAISALLSSLIGYGLGEIILNIING